MTGVPHPPVPGLRGLSQQPHASRTACAACQSRLVGPRRSRLLRTSAGMLDQLEQDTVGPAGMDKRHPPMGTLAWMLVNELHAMVT